MSTATLDTRADENQWIWESFRYHSRTFSLAARFLPRSVQMPIATLYLFCRRVDSIADQRVLEVGPERALDEVATVRDRLDETLAGHPPDDEVLWRRLAEVHDQYNLHRTPLEELIEGAVWDLQDRPIETKQDLIDYSNLVGGSVGAMMLPFLSDNGRFDTLETAARQLGIAMQITNIVRDVGEDIDHLGRVYLPTEWLEKYDVSRRALAEGRCVEGYASLLEAAMTAAEQHYRDSYDGIAALPFRTRVGIRAAARMYREILNEVRANEYDNLNHRAYVSMSRKLLLVAYDNYDWRKARLRT
ncbi:phytoene synthase [Salinibacter sp. 10B]|uniref:phytoene/squalene synthase family protein n=1 Tax=Salinibacter sp. 10B TaxID=1923971 RepID=UPI000CF39014|nr:phytoene/squalene synthase family protein [Salinibacter sp. 10B]PQJ33954.1 phytoene synthase [Salinibacter sp. 10B]